MRTIESGTISVTSTLRRRIPHKKLCTIAREVLGSAYELSIVIVGDARMQRINKTTRNKDTPTNVLAFPLGDTEGEIVLNFARIQKEAHRYGLSPTGHLSYLLIHACLHLKGYRHGSTMEEAENVVVNTFKLR